MEGSAAYIRGLDQQPSCRTAPPLDVGHGERKRGPRGVELLFGRAEGHEGGFDDRFPRRRRNPRRMWLAPVIHDEDPVLTEEAFGMVNVLTHDVVAVAAVDMHHSERARRAHVLELARRALERHRKGVVKP